MRLLNTKTLEFRDFLGANIPKYAILSHVWSDEEVSYDDHLLGRGRDVYEYGYMKIRNLCRLARESPVGHEPLEWAWIDTCCIDKRSSAELTEAINSMYKWYQNAEICFVFLPDVEPIPSTEPEQKFLEEQFLTSKWFTRGWTLQELLAPSQVLFFNTAFEFFGGKCTVDDYPSLSPSISRATGISSDALDASRIFEFCIAQKMSWASQRQTSREEDLAYCLLGLFDVNMPLLYGEGFSKAFQRLQLDILARTTDESIFAWNILQETRIDGTPKLEGPSGGLLSPSPRYFRHCGGVSEISNHFFIYRLNHRLKRVSYDISRRGIDVTMPVASRMIWEGKPTIQGEIWPLMCQYEGRGIMYLKIWIVSESPHMVGYADGAKLALRSGCVASNPSSTESDSRGQSHGEVDVKLTNDMLWKLRAEMAGVVSPLLLNLPLSEPTMYLEMKEGDGRNRTPSLTAGRLSLSRYLNRFGLRWEKQQKLYFEMIS